MYQPQKSRKRAAENTAEWVLLDANKTEIARSQPVIEDVIYEPVINDDGQTEQEWRRDLRRREMEEVFGQTMLTIGAGLSMAASVGVKYSLIGVGYTVKYSVIAIYHVVVFTVKMIGALAVMLWNAIPDTPDHDWDWNEPVKSKPRVDVETNIFVSGDADVNVKTNIHVNQ